MVFCFSQLSLHECKYAAAPNPQPSSCRPESKKDTYVVEEVFLHNRNSDEVDKYVEEIYPWVFPTLPEVVLFNCCLPSLRIGVFLKTQRLTHKQVEFRKLYYSVGSPGIPINIK
jgi:hypothetical protein